MDSGGNNLASNARPFRYGFYPVVAVAFLLFETAPTPQALAVAAWCLLWPLLADIASRGGGARRSLRLHLVEAALTCFLFAALGLPLALLQAVTMILLMSNALQGGLRQAGYATACAVPGLASGLVVAGPVSWPTATSIFSGLLLLAFCLLVAHVAFARVVATHGDRVRAHAQTARLQSYLPHTLAKRIGDPRPQRLERRWLVIVFADLVGFTRLVERLQMEEVATMLDSYLNSVNRVTRKWGGTLSKVIGDGALLVFGEEVDVPRRRLVADALGCCDELSGRLDVLTEQWRDHGLPGKARIKIGIASGYCSLGDWGGGGRLEYTVISQPVNLASRLQDLAAVGDTLLCERTCLLAEVPLSSIVRRDVKGLGKVAFRKVEEPSGQQGDPF